MSTKIHRYDELDERSDILIDEDDMVSNLATKCPSQQSVKAYVDNSINKSKTKTLVFFNEGLISNKDVNSGVLYTIYFLPNLNADDVITQLSVAFRHGADGDVITINTCTLELVSYTANGYLVSTTEASISTLPTPSNTAPFYQTLDCNVSIQNTHTYYVKLTYQYTAGATQSTTNKIFPCRLTYTRS